MSALAETADITNLRSEAAGRAEAQQETQKFAEAAIADSKREGLLLAVRARWVALAVIAVLQGITQLTVVLGEPADDAHFGLVAAQLAGVPAITLPV